MRFAAVFLVCAVLLAGARAEGDVLDLTEATFEQTINSNPIVLAEFFAPWCGHCKKLVPEYAQAATALKADGIVLAAIDATVERDLASKYGVRGYPTLKVFKNGQPLEYKGGRTADTIISYMRKISGPPAKTLETQADIDAIVAASKVVVVGYFADLSGPAYDTFIKLASEDDDNSYAVTTVADAEAPAPSVVLYKKFDEGKNVFSGSFDKAALQEFVAGNRVPSVIPFTMEAAGDIFQSPIGKIAFLFVDGEVPAWYADASKANKGKFVFATSDSSQSRLTSYLGISATDFPVFYILETGGQMKKFPLEGAPTEESVKAHLAAYLAGELKPAFKSAPVPESNDGPVKVVVGKNFQDVVMDESKDVLLEVYAPWCGHCKKLEPIYNELGAAFSGTDVVIAKMDGTENEVDGLSVKGFPTLKFYPKGKKAVGGEEYSGGRELADFTKFLAERTGVKSKDGHDEL